MTKYDERHGGPFDRGGADSWYRRAPNPHYWTGGSYQGEQVLENEMTEKEMLQENTSNASQGINRHFENIRKYNF